jgi:hypothetical protein
MHIAPNPDSIQRAYLDDLALLSLLPALQTVFLASQRQEQLFTPQHHIKISRPALAQCVADAQRLLFDNRAILEYSREIRSMLQANFS